MFKSIDLKEDLQKEQHRLFKDEAAFLQELKDQLKEDAQSDDAIINNIRSSQGNTPVNFNIDLIESNRLYSYSAIKQVCTKYRLRFLDSFRYAGDLPYEVVQKTKEFEQQHKTEAKSFKIMAPKQFFTLEDRYKDPLLFANLGNGYYYLIAKWGNDLSLRRKIKMLPFRNILTCLFSVAIFSTILSFCIPHSVFVFYGIPGGQIFSTKLWVALHLSIFFTMMTVFVCFAFHLYPSSYEWDSKLFN